MSVATRCTSGLFLRCLLIAPECKILWLQHQKPSSDYFLFYSCNYILNLNRLNLKLNLKKGATHHFSFQPFLIYFLCPRLLLSWPPVLLSFLRPRQSSVGMSEPMLRISVGHVTSLLLLARLNVQNIQLAASHYGFVCSLQAGFCTPPKIVYEANEASLCNTGYWLIVSVVGQVFKLVDTQQDKISNCHAVS